MNFEQANLATGKDYDFDLNCEEAAAAKNCRVFYPEAHQLTLDLDTEEQFKHFNHVMRDIVNIGRLDITNVYIAFSRSGPPHRHIIINLREQYLTVLEKTALQFMFGSDPVRERLNIYRHLRGAEQPIRLFRPLEGF